MLTNQSFNAFLKTLEEPPEHVKFLLATTDPQKLPVTVLSRCLQFNLKRMTPEHIVGHLKHVLTEEQIPFEEPALWLLARAADGSMRDALSLTDQAIAFGNQNLAASDVSNMLGTIDQRDIERIVATLVERDGPGLLAEISRISDFAPDYAVILADLLSLFHRVTMEQVVPGSADNALGDAAQVQSLAKQLSAEDAQLFYQAALMGRKDLAVTPDARMGFEMTLLRMLAFRPGADRREPPTIASGGNESQARAEPDPDPAPAQSHQPAPVTAQVPAPAQSPEPVPEPQPEPESAPEPMHAGSTTAEPETAPPMVDAPPWDPDPGDPALSAEREEPAALVGDVAPEPVQRPEPEQTQPQGLVEPEVEPVVEAQEPVTADGFVWERDFRQLDINGMPGNLASYSAMAMDGQTVVLTLDEGHARLLNARHEEKILAALRSRFGDATSLKIEQGEPGLHTPAAWEERQRAARQKAAEQAIRQDPVVKSIVERFEGRVVEESIRPIETGRR
jgi:DNA polymerase-3 subunit gamma/tau